MSESGWLDPGANQAQSAYLHSFRPRNYLIGGRGIGKTAAACIKAYVAGSMAPGQTGYITEQTTRDINDILLAAWIEHVPDGGAMLRHTQAGWEARLPNGTAIRFRSRHAKNTLADPPFRGPTAAFLIHDEIALDSRSDVPAISEMMLRDKNAPILFSDFITTPRPSWFFAHVMGQGLWKPNTPAVISADGKAAAFYGSTRDNAHNRELYARMVGRISEREALQELEGQFVPAEGLVWTGFSEDTWPLGSMHDSAPQPGAPYVLAVDHGGADGAWLILQTHPSQGRFGGSVWVVVAEYSSHGKPAHVILPEIKKRWGKPVRAFAGADHDTPGNTGDTARHLFVSHGWDHVETITGERASKELQINALSAALLNTAGERRLTVSRSLESHIRSDQPTRSVLDMLRHDTWPDPGSSDRLRKEKKKGIFHEDVRDALLYWAIGTFPPIWSEHTRWAA